MAKTALHCLLLAALAVATGCGGGGGSAPLTTTLRGRLLLQQSTGGGPAALMLRSSSGQDLGGLGLGGLGGANDFDREPNDQLFSAVDLMGDGKMLPLSVGGKTGSNLDRVDIYRFGPFQPEHALQRAIAVQFWSVGDLELTCLRGQDLRPAEEAAVLLDGQVAEYLLNKGEELVLIVQARGGRTASAAANYRFELRGQESTGLGTTGLERGSARAMLARSEPLDSVASASILKRCLGGKRAELIPGEILIKSPGSKSLIAEKMSALGFELIQEGGDVQRFCHPRLAADFATMDSFQSQLIMANQLRDVRRVVTDAAYVSPNLNMPLSGLAKLQGLASKVEPNDTLYGSNQWNLRLNKFPAAWMRTTGSPDVTLAVMDTGLATRHPDLAARVSPFSYDFISDPQSAGDGDGVDPDPNEPPAIGAKTIFHGTYVTGVLGAVTDNNLGVAAGVWKGKVIALRIIGGKGGSSFDRIQAWRYLAGLSNVSGRILPAENRPKVLNMSFAMFAISKAELDELVNLAKSGVICVAAVGNNFNKDSPPVYPAAVPEVIGVGAVDENGKVTAYSNAGDFVELVAAGGLGLLVPSAVTSTWVFEGKNIFGSFEGTSLATPLVCSTIALMEVLHQGIEDVTVRRVFRESSKDLGPIGKDKESGYGLLDADKALARAIALNVSPFPDVTPTSFTFRDDLSELELEVKNAGGRVLRELELLSQPEVSGGITFVIRGEHAPTTIDVSIDRKKVKVGEYNDFFEFQTNGGKVLLSFRYRKPIPTKPAKDLIVRILRGTKVLSSTVADSEGAFKLEKLPLGQFRLEAGIDVNGNGKLGDSQEWYLNIPISIDASQTPELKSTVIPWKN